MVVLVEERETEKKKNLSQLLSSAPINNHKGKYRAKGIHSFHSVFKEISLIFHSKLS